MTVVITYFTRLRNFIAECVSRTIWRQPKKAFCPCVFQSFKNCSHLIWGIDITKTYLYNFDPLKPHFYIVKLGFIGVYIIFLFLLKNIDCGYPLEPPRRGGSNEYPQSMFWADIWKISEFLTENFQFLVVKFSIYLNRHVFVIAGLCAFLCVSLFCACWFASLSSSSLCQDWLWLNCDCDTPWTFLFYLFATVWSILDV